MFHKPLYDPFDDRVVEPQTPPVVPNDCGAPVGKASQMLVFVVALGVLLIFVAFVGGMYFAKNRTAAVVSDDVVADADEPVVDDTADDVESDDDDVPPVGEYELTVEWKPVSEQGRFPIRPDIETLMYGDYSRPAGEEAFSLKLGTVSGGYNGGEYDGYELTVQYAGVEGLGTAHHYLYVLEGLTDDKPDILLGRHSSYVGSFGFPTTARQSSLKDIFGDRVDDWKRENPSIVIDEGAVIPELEHEDRVVDMQGRAFRFAGLYTRTDFPEVFPVGSYADKTTLEDGTTLYLYAPDSSAPGFSGPHVGINQFYFVREDGRMVWYDLEVSFMDYEAAAVNERTSLGMGMPRIMWEGSNVNTTIYYKGDVGGCGLSTLTNVVDADLIEEFDLVYVGDTLNAQGRADASSVKIYAPNNLEHEHFQQTFYRIADGQIESITEVQGGYPYAFFQDSFGRWIELMNANIVGGAECGKPVIYLYPERDTEMTVRVEPQGGFSFTEPEYRDGWRVTAQTNGRVVNLDDGREYPYLFWEGRGGLYAEPEYYWIVAQKDVHGFLVETLGEMGLTARETFDFIEFWGPRMQSAPYYKIGFHGTEVMDALAPLSLSVEPDSIFRVLMDYEELDAPQSQNPPKRLPHFERKGFAVLEWGGVLR